MIRRLVHIRKPGIPLRGMCGEATVRTRYVDEVDGRVKVCRDCAWDASYALDQQASQLRQLDGLLRMAESERDRSALTGLWSLIRRGGEAHAT